MFQGMKSGDELVMNVKLSGCLFQKDCQLNCDAHHSSRIARDTTHQPSTEIAHLSFRVVDPTAEVGVDAAPFNSYQRIIAATSCICFIGVLILIIAHLKRTPPSSLWQLQPRIN